MAATEDKLVTMSQLKRYVESVIGGGGGSSTVLYEGGGQEQVSLRLTAGEYDYLEVVFGWGSTTGYLTNNSWVSQNVMMSPSGGTMGYRATFDTSYSNKLLKIKNMSSSTYVDIYKVTGYKN